MKSPPNSPSSKESTRIAGRLIIAKAFITISDRADTANRNLVFARRVTYSNIPIAIPAVKCLAT